MDKMDKIDYSQIEEKCIPLVKFFNSIGLKTKYCCEGHEHSPNSKFFIIFDKSISDEKFINFIEKFSNKYNHSPFRGSFSKWYRKTSGKIVYNWQYTVTFDNYELNQSFAKIDYELFISKYNINEINI